MESEENRRGLQRGRGMEGSGGGAEGKVLGKSAAFHRPRGNTSSNGCFPSGFPLTLVPSPFHSFRRSLDASVMLMSALGTGATEARSWASDKPGTVFVHATPPPSTPPPPAHPMLTPENRTKVQCGSTLQNSAELCKVKTFAVELCRLSFPSWV